MKDPQSELASLKYILNCMWDALAKKSGDCETCDDVVTLKLYLSKLCNEQGIRIKLDKN